jgi:hypothetical protein
MNYRLYISFKDDRKNEKIVFQDSDLQHLYEEMKYSEAYGLASELLNFPSFDIFQNKLTTLSVGQLIYVLRAKIEQCSYIVSVKRLA